MRRHQRAKHGSWQTGGAAQHERWVAPRTSLSTIAGREKGRGRASATAPTVPRSPWMLRARRGRWADRRARATRRGLGGPRIRAWPHPAAGGTRGLTRAAHNQPRPSDERAGDFAVSQRTTATNAADSQADVAQAARRAPPGRCGGQRRFRRSASGSGAGSTTRSASTRWARTHARAAVTTRRSIARPGCTPGPRTTRPAARARASRSRARSACPSHGNASSSQVETTWKPCPSASSIVGATSGRREPVVTTAIGARPAAAASERHTGTPRSGASERNSTPPARRDPSSRAIDRPMGPSPTTTQDLPASALNAPRPNPTRSPNPNPNPNPSPSPNPSPFPRRHPPSGARVRSAPSHVRAAWRLPPRPRPGVRPAPRVARDRLCSASISATRSATRRSARCRGVRRRRSVRASPPRPDLLLKRRRSRRSAL